MHEWMNGVKLNVCLPNFPPPSTPLPLPRPRISTRNTRTNNVMAFRKGFRHRLILVRFEALDNKVFDEHPLFLFLFLNLHVTFTF